ncbi:hypothetical protein QWZ04_18320 [Vibrio tapetis subsp. quintayensis]|uniref:hypothetical protein n=1 Tax=Vibrio tapetis TaxID=52443 RepID=UPI0025B51684|nr:hypothetical protein [Vibrio tapetis]MDN3682261.1 hypothetical protein [Vibrio tapetis subsp. quintayensis]
MKGIGILLTVVMLVVALNTDGLLRSIAELAAFVALALTAYQIKSARSQSQLKRTQSVKS